jgi:hypothetical protein
VQNKSAAADVVFFSFIYEIKRKFERVAAAAQKIQKATQRRL